MLARINTDISLADFEAGVRNLVNDVEDAYWELYFAYRNLEASKSGRASALQTWKKIHALFEVGGKGGEAEKEAQAREQYFLFRGQVQTALRDLHRAEQRLRYILGLAVSDGRLIRPCDEPTTAEVKFDWSEIHCEGIARSVELRRQKWRIKQRELELIAARNLLQPRLDVVGRYRWLGLGDDLLDSDRDAETGGIAGTNAFQSLTGGDFQEWQLGLQSTLPIGFRRELSTIRHFQLQLTRERARLQDQELEVSHQLGDAIGNLEFNYDLTITNFNRRVAAEKQVQAVQAAFEAETVTLDLLLDAQRRRADAEIAYYRALVDYNRGIKQVHFRKGSLLEYNGVYLTEGPWPAKALFDAHRLARQRDASYYLDYGFTRPRVISEGAYQQHGGHHDMADDMMSAPDEGQFEGSPEEVPTPAIPKEEAKKPTSRLSKRSAPRLLEEAKVPALKQQPRNRRASNEAPKTFDWGGLGLDSRQEKNDGAKGAVDPRRASLTKVDENDLASQLVAPPTSALPKPVEMKLPVAQNENATVAVDAGRANGAVQPVAYQWKSNSSNEPVADHSPGATDRVASGWKRSKR